MMQGEPCHLEVTSTDSSGTGTAFLIYLGGSATARTLLATEYLVVTALLLNMAAGGAYCVCSAADSAGRRIAKGTLAALGHIEHHFETPYACPQGVVPKLIAASGQVDCEMDGYICQA